MKGFVAPLALTLSLALACAAPGAHASGAAPRPSHPPAAEAENDGSIRLSLGPLPPPRAAAPAAKPAPKPASKPAAQIIDAGARGPIQLAPVSTDGESTVVEELEVIGHALGPAMWTVSRGDSQVVVLATYRPLLHTLTWNQARLERALDGATALYVPKTSVGVIGGAGLLLTMGSLSLGGGRTLPDILGPTRTARLRSLAERAHSKLDKLMTRKPAVAGYTLYTDFVRAAGFSLEKPDTTVQRLARAHHVPIRALARINAAPLLRSLQKLDDAGQLACYDAALAQVDAVSNRGVAAGRAWGEGRLGELRSLKAPGLEDACLVGVAGSRAVIERGTADSVASIEDALKRPGRSVALVPIEYLTQANGVLDRLKAKGAEIGVPAG